MSAVSESALISSLFHVSSPTRSSSSTSSALFFGLTTVLNSLRFCSKQRLVVEVPSLSMGVRPKRYDLSSLGVFYNKNPNWLWVSFNLYRTHKRQRLPFFIVR
ncbi:unnamed protein product [Brassica oleracea var. botrytis]|uniref:Uncharacterized protein n=1 Tax=Brassica carinata TaxID=52824 RepID=A0A8X7QGJ3_BRACI|nr:hypothetical protein Bca52824_063918 [Brassica carinata]